MDAMHSIPNDRLLDHAQGRLSPAELAEISRQMAEDAGLQARYAELRRLRRLVRESYRPNAVARPDARDEEMAGTIAGFCEAIREGVLPDAPESMQEFAASNVGEFDYAEEDTPSSAGAGGHVISGPWLAAAESARISNVVMDGARGAAARRWRSAVSYAAAAAVLLMAAWWSVGTDEPMVNSPASGRLQVQLSPQVTPPPMAAAEAGNSAEATTARIDTVPDSNPGMPGMTTPQDPGELIEQPTPTPVPVPPVAPDAGSVVGDNAGSAGNGSARPEPIDVDNSFADARRAFQSSSVSALAGSQPAEDATPRVIVGRTVLRGDVDGNGVIDERDYRFLRDRVLRNDAWQLGAAADVNGDHTVDTRDLATLLTITAGSGNSAARGN